MWTSAATRWASNSGPHSLARPGCLQIDTHEDAVWPADVWECADSVETGGDIEVLSMRPPCTFDATDALMYPEKRVPFAATGAAYCVLRRQGSLRCASAAPAAAAAITFFNVSLQRISPPTRRSAVRWTVHGEPSLPVGRPAVTNV